MGGAGAATAARGGAGAWLMSGGKMGVVGLLTSIAMTGKDAYDLWSSAEERLSKKGENIGGLVGSLVGALGFIGGPFVGAMTMMLGNTIGEMIGKSLDADRDPRVRAQMTALGRELDNLEVARQEVLDSQLDITEKQKRLTAIDKKINAAEAEAQDIKGRESEVERLQLEKERKLLLEQKEKTGQISTTWMLNEEMKQDFVADNEELIAGLVKGEVTADKLNKAFLNVEEKETSLINKIVLPF